MQPPSAQFTQRPFWKLTGVVAVNLLALILAFGAPAAASG